jgi:hypothetical protein
LKSLDDEKVLAFGSGAASSGVFEWQGSITIGKRFWAIEDLLGLLKKLMAFHRSDPLWSTNQTAAESGKEKRG